MVIVLQAATVDENAIFELNVYYIRILEVQWRRLNSWKEK
jgi:hypothetical protein